MAAAIDIGIGDAFRIAFAAIARRLPSWIVRRWYSQSRVADRFGVDLVSVRRLEFRFGAALPELVLAFRYVNLNPFPVRVDRVDFEIWIGQPVFKNQQRIGSRIVGAYAADPPISWDSNRFPADTPPRFEFQMDPGQADYIRRQLTDGRLANDLIVHFDVFGSALGRPFTKEGQRIEISRDELPPIGA